jgi:hypothetical protein
MGHLNRAEFLEELTHLLDGGEAPSRICKRLGTNIDAISKRLYSYGADARELKERFMYLSTREKTNGTMVNNRKG